MLYINLEIWFMKNIYLLLILVFIFSCSKDSEQKFLIVASNGGYPPFSYLDENSREAELTGFDIAIAQEIANDMGKTLKVENMLFEDIIPAVESGKADMAIRAITITDDRKDIISFSSSYYVTAQTVVIRKGDNRFKNIKTKEELGATIIIGVEATTTGSIAAHEIATYHPVVELHSTDEMIYELSNENVDALLTDKDIAKAIVDKFDDRFEMISLDFEIENYGIIVAKDNHKLLTSINSTISKLINSGIYSELVEEHIQDYFNKQ